MTVIYAGEMRGMNIMEGRTLQPVKKTSCSCYPWGVACSCGSRNTCSVVRSESLTRERNDPKCWDHFELGMAAVEQQMALVMNEQTILTRKPDRKTATPYSLLIPAEVEKIPPPSTVLNSDVGYAKDKQPVRVVKKGVGWLRR